MIRSIIIIGKCNHQNKELDCYIPQIDIGKGWTNILDAGSYILKDSFNPLKRCSKCVGKGINCYLDKSLELIWDRNSKCKECNGIGLRKGESKDLKYIAQMFIDIEMKKIKASIKYFQNYAK